uniref:Uncharacterized protein n=1 Tax=uncultured prokaryote TaxID=198431 RepID=A0A0H5Q5J9_9ZZZZ|nr:hypothetical protein [uncultured prokaryote]
MKRKFADPTSMHDAADVIKRAFKKVRSAKAVAPSIRSYVSRAIGRHSETKTAIMRLTNTGVTAVSNTVIPNADIQICPIIEPGANNGQRLGSRISPTKAILRVNVFRTSTALTQPASYVRVVVGRLKDNLDSAFSVLAYWQQLVYSQAATPGGVGVTSVGPTSLASETRLLPYNREVWDIAYSRDIKISESQNATTAGYDNNDFSLTAEVMVDLTKKFKKRWTYSTAAGGNNLPQNDGWFLTVFPFSANEDAYSAPPATPFKFSAVLTMNYKDE